MKLNQIIKTVSKASNVGKAVVNLGNRAADLADRVIHRKEYEKAKKRALACKIVLGVAVGVLVVLLFPYKVVVEKNGDFEVRSLLLRIFRKTPPYEVPEGGTEEFDLLGAEDEFAECAVIESVDED